MIKIKKIKCILHLFTDRHVFIFQTYHEHSIFIQHKLFKHSILYEIQMNILFLIRHKFYKN